VWDAYEDAATVLVDVPIGLREESSEQRKCDTAARQKLSPLRHYSVFPPPVRSVTHCESYEAAKREQEPKTDGSLGTQTWAISREIREVDSLLIEDSKAREMVQIEDSIRSRVYEQCQFQLLNRQLRSLRIVFRGVTPVEAGSVDPDDTVVGSSVIGWLSRISQTSISS
jgi:predicted RNase H-like nuclease